VKFERFLEELPNGRAWTIAVRQSPVRILVGIKFDGALQLRRADAAALEPGRRELKSVEL
jgi:hypothetical protein